MDYNTGLQGKNLPPDLINPATGNPWGPADVSPNYNVEGGASRVGMRPTPDEVQKLPRPTTKEEALKLGPGKLFIDLNGYIGQTPSTQPAQPAQSEKQPPLKFPKLGG